MQIFLFLLIILSFLIFSLFLINYEYANSNGIRNNFGLDILPALNVDDTPISLWVEFKPSMVESIVKEKRQLILKLIDIDTNNTYIPKSTEISIFKNIYNNGNITEELFLNGTFVSDVDSLTLEFNSYDNKKEGKYNNSIKDSKVLANSNGIIHVNQPVLNSGYYHLKVKVNISNLGIKNQDFLQFDTFLSLGDIVKIKDFNFAKEENITILSYNDIVVNKSFNKDTNEISFKIPFNYNLTRIEEGFIYIHTELKIPKELSKSYNYNNSNIKINDINFKEISSGSVSVDPFSNSSSLIIHYILDSNSLFKLTKEMENTANTPLERTIKFSLIP